MKKLLLLLLFSTALFAQNQIPIPATLTGGAINLSLHTDSVAFLAGTRTNTFGYNSNPYLGPTLILTKNQLASISVTNQIGETTALHWHGLHVSAMNDGGPHNPILNNSTWNPQFTVLNKAGTYWYHPHLDSITAIQTMKGALGFIIVKDDEEALLPIPRNYGIDDFPIVVQTAQLNAQNQFMQKGMQDSLTFVNGVRCNYGQTAFLSVPSQVIRMRLLNGAGERSYNFGLSGNKQFKIIGSDGGLLNAPVAATRIRMSPGERYEILIDLNGMQGQSLQFMSFASEIPIGTQGGPTMPMPVGSPPMDSPLNGVDFSIFQLNIGTQTTNPILSIPPSLVTVTPILEDQATTTRAISMTALDPLSMDGPFYFNASLFNMNTINFYIPLNSTEIWALTNNTMVAHPFHLHDEQFYILDRDGNTPPDYEKGRKDVVLIEPNETVRIITKFTDFADETMPYMYHCHVLMHEDDGMMGQFIVSSVLSTADSVKSIPLKLYPNPVLDSFSFQLEEINTNYDIRIIDMSGKVVFSESDRVEKKVNTQNIKKGNYIVLIKANKNYYSSKIMKQ